jgi:hypothetical protein
MSIDPGMRSYVLREDSLILLLCRDSDYRSVSNSPCSLVAQWIIAAGYLEKERESALQLARPAWASRFFVLTYTSLFWFRKPDIKDDLFGEEHGKVLLRDLLPVESSTKDGM